MSKKIASGADAIVLDVKCGSGGFVKTQRQAEELAGAMTKIGTLAGKKTVAFITDMDVPLGCSIGNSLEIIESIETLKGNGPEDLTVLCVELSAHMLSLSGIGSLDDCRKQAKNALMSGKALDKLAEMTAALGGDEKYIYDTSLFNSALIKYEVKSQKSGYIAHMDTANCGIAACILGAGRETIDSVIDFSAGIELIKKTGDYTEKGETICVMHSSCLEKIKEAEDLLLRSLQYSDTKPENKLLFTMANTD
jgi:pyrimidine-nucleoside phosphorylase